MHNDPVRSAADILTEIQREDYGRLLAALVRRFGDLDLAEDIAQDAMAAALETWPRTGVPAKPLAWLMTTAKRRAIDTLRREASYARRLAELRVEEERRSAPAPEISSSEPDDIPDERLELFFACCHPTLRPEEQIALTLRFLAGLTTAEVAAAFLVPVTTMQARLTRAKKRIRVSRIPLAVPAADQLPQRLPTVLHIVYLIFTEGYAATRTPEHIRAELTVEALRLARILAKLMPRAEVLGLLALILLTEARAPARIDRTGVLVALEDQDRTLWRTEMLEEGIEMAERAAAASAEAGPYAIQATIAAVHAEAPHFASTDWVQIVALYDILHAVTPGPVVALNRAIALGQRDGMPAGLELLDGLAAAPELAQYHPYHAARAVTLEKLGRKAAARAAWQDALCYAENPAERSYIECRLAALGRS